MGNRPFFIVGSGRSGTTLLRAILDARDDVRIPGETHFYTTYRVENIFRYHFLTKNNYEKAVRNYKLWRHVSYESLDWDVFCDVALKLPPKRSSILSAYLSTCACCEGAAFYGEKTPGHIRKIDRIFADFPTSKVIHVSRDPRAVAASYLKHSLYASVYGNDVTRAAKKWLEAAKVDEKISNSVLAHRYLLVTYEDLVNSTDSTILRINRFLELPKFPQQLQQYESSVVSLPDSPNHQQIGQPINSSSLYSWKHELAESDIELVEAICGKYLVRQNYELSGVSSISKVRRIVHEARYYYSFFRKNIGRLMRAVSNFQRS